MLKRSQLDEVAVDLQQRFPDQRALAAELLRRGWLTAFQVNQVLRGKSAELVLDAYVLTERLGEGGMGEVYKARHQKLDRVAALKLIRKDKADSEEVIRRFRREIEAVSQLSHPNIVAAFDAGQAGDILFFAMEFIEGTDLSRLVREHGPLPIPTACDYMRQAAAGLGHAHERGMVHRDIKPANLLLTREGAVKIADLGLARWRRSAGEESSTKALTRDGAVLGTLDYVAPEQAMDSHAVDIRADLYSLGCTFYFLLAGRVPHPGGEAIEKLYRHRYQEPTLLEQVRPETPPAVAAVVRQLLAKQPEDRFQTPAELVSALTAIAAGQPLPATDPVQPPASDRTELEAPTPPAQPLAVATSADSVVPQPRRQRRWVGVLAATVLLLCGLALLAKTLLPEPAPHTQPVLNVKGAPPTQPPSSALATIKATEKSAPVGYVARASREESLLATLAAHGLPNLQGPWYVIGPFDNPDRKGFDAVYGPEEGIDLKRSYPGKGGQILSWQEWAEFQPGDLATLPKSRENCCYYLYHAIACDRATTLPLAIGSCDALTVWLNGRRLLAKNVTRPVVPHQDRVTLDLQAGTNRLLLKVCTHAARSLELCVLPELPVDLQARYGDRLQQEFERITVKETRRFSGGHSGAVSALVLSKQGRHALTAGSDKFFLYWDVADGQLVRKIDYAGSPIQGLTFLPDGKRALTAHGATKGVDATVRLWDLATGTEVRRFDGHTDLVTSVACSADGRRALSGSWDGTLHFWDVETGKPLQVCRLMPPSYIYGVALTPDGTRALAACADSTIRVWDLQANREIGKLRGHTDKVRALDLSADGKQLVSGGWDQTVRLWDVEKGAEIRRFDGHRNLITGVALSADGERVASCGYDTTIRLWDARTGRELRRFVGHFVQVRGVAFLPDRSALLSADDRSLRVWALAR
ncbi:MAG: protein kinase [Planctomycetia bacterium]|nr:protein kinase [Planctomycetia bacterium]